MRLRRTALLAALLLLPACGSVASWVGLDRFWAPPGTAPGPRPYSGLVLDGYVISEGWVFAVLDLPLSLVFDTAALPITLTIWLVQSRSDAHPPPVRVSTPSRRVVQGATRARPLTIGVPDVVVVEGEHRNPERFEFDLVPGRSYVVQVTGANPAFGLPRHQVRVTPPSRPPVSATLERPGGVRLPETGSFAVDRAERWVVEVWRETRLAPSTIHVLVRDD